MATWGEQSCLETALDGPREVDSGTDGAALGDEIGVSTSAWLDNARGNGLFP